MSERPLVAASCPNCPAAQLVQTQQRGAPKKIATLRKMKKYFYSLEKVVQLRQLSSWSRPCSASSAIRCTKIKLAVLEEKKLLAVQKD